MLSYFCCASFSNSSLISNSLSFWSSRKCEENKELEYWLFWSCILEEAMQSDQTVLALPFMV